MKLDESEPTQQKVVIIGAGPSGLLLAHYLLHASRSDRKVKYCVSIYEKRLDPVSDVSIANLFPDVDSDKRKRSFPISLQERGLNALRGIPGLEYRVKKRGVFCGGSCMHGNKGGKPRQFRRKNAVLVLDRNLLVSTLLDSLREGKHADDELNIQFGVSCQQIDLEQRTVTLQKCDFRDDSNVEFTVPFDRLVGADGARSFVREHLSKYKSLKFEESLIPDAYKIIFLQRKNIDLGIELAPNRIHTASVPGECRLILAPQKSTVEEEKCNAMHGALIFDAEENPIESLQTTEDIMEYFRVKFPTFHALMPLNEAQELVRRPSARTVTVKCERFHDDDRVLLLGDAAHAVSASMGQGCNSALQDVMIFNDVLTKFDDDWSQALPEFSRHRVGDAHALRELSNNAFPPTKALMAEFYTRMVVSRTLHGWFPGIFQPFLMDMMMDTDASYSDILKHHSRWIEKVKRGKERKTTPGAEGMFTSLWHKQVGLAISTVVLAVAYLVVRPMIRQKS